MSEIYNIARVTLGCKKSGNDGNFVSAEKKNLDGTPAPNTKRRFLFVGQPVPQMKVRVQSEKLDSQHLLLAPHLSPTQYLLLAHIYY